MSTANALLVLIAAVWASLNARMSAYAMINQRRDTILTGRFDKVEITLEHRWLIFERDWKPLAWGAVFPSFLFAFVVVLIPNILPGGDANFAIVSLCALVSAYHALAALATARHVVAESKFIERYLREESARILAVKFELL